jgi:hypothetical protein
LPRVKELVRIFHLSTLGECQPYGVLEGIAKAEYSIMSPHGGSLGLLPGFFHFTSSTKAGSACLIKARSSSQHLTPPIIILFEYGMYLAPQQTCLGKTTASE